MNEDQAGVEDAAGMGRDEYDSSGEQARQLMILEATAKTNIYGPLEPVIVRQLQASQNLPKSVGAITAKIVGDVLQTAREQNKQVDQAILMELGGTVVNEVYTLAAFSRIWEPGDERQQQDEQHKALMFAARDFSVRYADLVDKQGTMQFMQGVAAGDYDEEQAPVDSQTQEQPQGLLQE